MHAQAIVAGLICLDVTPRFLGGDIPAPGRLTLVGPATISTGGAVSNTGLSLHRLGIPARLCGKIGDDMFGQAVRDVLERSAPGSSQGLIISPQDTTGYTIVLATPGQDRSFLHCPGANDTFAADDIGDDVLGRSDLLHFGYPPVIKLMWQNDGAELVHLFRRARAAGLTTSLDMCMVDPHAPSGQVDWDRILRNVLPHVDFFVPSLDELSLIWDQGAADDDPAAAMARLGEKALQAGAKVVLLKAGPSGIYLRSAGAAALAHAGRAAPQPMAAWADRELWAPAFTAQPVVTTTGAGDAAVAGFLAGVLRRCPPELALTTACAAGTCACEQADTTSGVRTWQDTLERVQAGWPRLPLDPGAPGWRWDAVAGLWRGPHDRSA